MGKLHLDVCTVGKDAKRKLEKGYSSVCYWGCDLRFQWSIASSMRSEKPIVVAYHGELDV